MERRKVLGVVIAVGLVLLLAAFAFFRPDKLFVDEVVEEDLDADIAAALEATTTAPSTTSSEPSIDGDTTATAAPPTTAAPAGPMVVAAGSWISLGRYSTSGDVAVVGDGDTATLVLDELTTDNGPDLFVYLSPADAVDGEQLPDGSLNLGGLRGNIGTQSYEIPPGTDISQYSSVVIWCERFSSAFGAAQLNPA